MERQGANQNLIYSSKSSAAAKLKIISRNSGMLEKKTQPSNVIPEPQHFYRYPDSNASLNSTRTQGIGAGLGVSQSPRAFRIGQTKKSIPFLAPGSTQVAQLGDLSLSNLYGNPDISLNVRKPFIGLQHQDRLQTGNPSPAPQSSNYFASSARGSATNASTNLANTNLQGVFSSSKTSKILDTSDGTEERYQSSLQKYLIMKPNKLGREVSPPSKAVYLPSPNTTQMGPSMLSSLVQSPVDTPETTNEKVRQQTRGTADKVSAFMPNLKLQSSPRVLSKQPSLIAKDNLLKTPIGMGASPMRMKIEIKPRKQDEAQEADTDGKNEQLTAGSSQTNKAGTKNGFTSALFFARSGSSSSLTSAAVMAQKEGLEQQQPPALNLTGTPVAKGETQPQETKPSPIQTVKLESGSLGKVPPREESTLPSPSRAHRFTIKWTASTWPKIEEEIRVDKLLGQGSFAKVYQGFDLVKKIIVAIKVLDKRKISEMGFNKMAEKELEVLQLVRHPNIGNFERMLEDKNRVYILMELCGGMTLSQYCRTQPNKRLSDDHAFRVFYPILRSVAYLHSKSISHRDIKLTNLLVDRDNRIKLIDFGFADNSGRSLRAYCGTPSYMAPEIVMKKDYSGMAVDVWALGVVLYKLLTGEYAFGSEEDPALNEKILGGAPYYEFYITPYCKAFLKACFTLDSKKRPTTAELLAMPWIEHHRAKDQNTAEPSLF